jgi:hypothetical protein
MLLSLINSPSGNHLVIRKRLWLVILSIVSITSPIAAWAVPPCLIATVRVSSKFRALRERSHIKRIWLQILKILKVENNTVREFLRCKERGHMFKCLVILISLVTILQSILCSRPGSLIIFFLATILRPGHVCSIQ